MSDVNKAARDYLKASGASAISVVAIDGVCTFQAGHKIDPNAVSTHWVREEQAAALVKQARHDAGRAPDAATGTAQPDDQRITLTAHTVAMGRAEAGAKRLDDYLGGLRGTGVLEQGIQKAAHGCSRERQGLPDLFEGPGEIASWWYRC